MEVDEDCDEDVIFENSPLYQHLKEAGLADIDVEPVRSVSLHAQLQQVNTQKQGQPKVSLVTRLCRNCKDYLTSIFHQKQVENTITLAYQATILKKLCTAPILVEEDRDFLEDFVSEEVSEKGKKTPSKFWSWLKFMFPSLLLPSFLAALTARVISPDTSSSLVVDIGLCITGLVGVTSIAVLATDCWRRRYYEGKWTSLSYFVNRAHHLVTLARKSLRLIQETELVARGFTLVSQKTAVSQLDQKPSMSNLRQCPELRRYLFNMARSSTLELREATLKLINQHPLIPEIDSISHYLCGISLEEYGPCLSHPLSNSQGGQGEGEGELYNLTDGYSVAALKAMTELFSLHLSEFGRRLALCFSSQSQPPDREKQDPFQTEVITSNLHERLRSKELTLNRLYDFHKSSPQGRQSKPHTTQHKCTSQTEEFYIAVHSLDLHLQAAITRVRDLASELEAKIEEQAANLNEDPKESANQKWESFMSGVKAELEACKGCWEEGMTRLENTKKNVPKLEAPVEVQPKTDQSKAVIFAEMGDPIIEDQVFEGYTDPDEVEGEPWGWEPILSPEEREKKKREKQEALRLLTELKSVITVRAQDRERREQVALHRMRQGKTTLVQSDQSHHRMGQSDQSVDRIGHSDQSLHRMGQSDQSLHRMGQPDQSQSNEGGTCDSITEASQNVPSLNDDLNLGTTGSIGYSDGDSSGRVRSERLENLGMELDHDSLENKLIQDSYACSPEVANMNTEEVNKHSFSMDQLIKTDAKAEQSEYRDNSLDQFCESDVQNCETQISQGSSSGSTDHKNVLVSSLNDHSEGDVLSSTSIDVSSAPSKAQTARNAERSELKERLERLHGSHLGFTANVAAMAAARSAHLGLSEQTFGDTFGDSSSEESEEDS